MFEPEYAEVLGVPFTFLDDEPGTVQAPKPVLVVRALPERALCGSSSRGSSATATRCPTDRLTATFDEDASPGALHRRGAHRRRSSTRSWGRSNSSLDALREQRLNTVVFAVAKRTLDNYFRDEEGGERPWLFPQLVRITRDWIDECVALPQGRRLRPELLLLAEYSHAAAEHVYRAIVLGTAGEQRLMPDPAPLRRHRLHGRRLLRDDEALLRHHEEPHQQGRPGLGLGDQARRGAGGMPEVVAYAKNQGLNFKIPYTYEGRPPTTCRTSSSASAMATDPDDLLTLVAGGHRRAQEGEAGQGGDGHRSLDAGDQQLGRSRALGVPRGHRPWDAANLIRATFLPSTALLKSEASDGA